MRVLKTEVYNYIREPGRGKKRRLTWCPARVQFHWVLGEWKPGWVFEARNVGWTSPDYRFWEKVL